MTKIITHFACLNPKSFSYLFAFLFLFCAFPLFSQKDLSVQLLEPVDGQKIYPNDSFTLKLMITNLGPEDVNPIDPIGVDAIVGGNFVYSTVFATYIPVGQSYIFEQKITYNFTGDHPNQQFCSTATLLFPPDTLFFNNIDCNTVDLFQVSTNTGNLNDQLNNIIISPNPANGVFNLRLNNINPEELDLQIYDSKGANVYMKKNFNLSQEIDITQLPKGLYYIVLTGNNVHLTSKLLNQ